MLTCPACSRPNPADARFCMGCATRLADAVTTRETRTTATALFCDLVGSTALGELHDPELLRPIFHAYFDDMRAAVAQHGGRVEKLIGDAVTAVFGSSAIDDNHALSAVRAGVEMTERLKALNARASISLACRVGITTSEMLVLADGDALPGDALAAASRLQAWADPGSVIIGEATWQLVRNAVAAQPIRLGATSGAAQPLIAYRVLGLS